MNKRLLLVIIAVIVALAAMVVVSQPELFTAEGRNARFLRSLDRSGLVVRRSCYSTEAFVQASQWARIGQGDQQRAAEALGAYCAQQGSSGQMTILDGESRRKLAHWDGAAFQRF